MTVHQVATATRYSHDYMRKRLREALDNDEIEGAKLDPVIACNIHGGRIILRSNFSGMMEDLEAISHPLATRARTQVVPGDVPGLQKFIKRHASATYQIESRWRFWYPTSTPPGKSSSSPAASADD